MKMYFSGTESIQDVGLRDEMIERCECRLQSCHGNYVTAMYKWLERSVEIGASSSMNIMLDSGAFTAWSKGHVMEMYDLQRVYENIQNKYQNMFKSIVYINLDVIPGSRNKKPTQKEIDDALLQSDINYTLLRESMGDVILPVFHQGEDFSRLSHLQETTSFVCISPLQTLSEPERVNWTRHVRHHVTGSSTRLHGLATTGNIIIRTGDWYSVDSSTWVVNGGFGNVFILSDKSELYPLPISIESPSRHIKEGHLTTLNKYNKTYVMQFITSRGFDPKALSVSSEHRKCFNLIVMKEWVDSIETEQTTIQQGLF